MCHFWWCLCVGVEAFFGARGVDVVQLLLLLGLDVLVLLHPAGVLQVAPVSSQRHQEVDLRRSRGMKTSLLCTIVQSKRQFVPQQ